MNDPLGVHSAVLGMLSLSKTPTLGTRGFPPAVGQQIMQNGGHFQQPISNQSHMPNSGAGLSLNGNVMNGTSLTNFAGGFLNQGYAENRNANSISNHMLNMNGMNSNNQGLFNSNITSIDGTQLHHSATRLPLTPPGSPPDELQPKFQHLQPKSTESLASIMNTITSASLPTSINPDFYAMSQYKDQDQESLLSRSLSSTPVSVSGSGRRVGGRSEKRPIPADKKDGKYFERRKRNNSAAKKSRDNRKQREEEIAVRASYLERENSILQAQIQTLREEAQSLTALLKQKSDYRMQQQMIAHHNASLQTQQQQSLG